MYNKKNYVADAIRTRPPQQPLSAEDSVLLLAAIGMVGETGEVFEAAETFIFNQHKEGGVAKLLKELGDVTWYGAALADAKGFDIAPMFYRSQHEMTIVLQGVLGGNGFGNTLDKLTKDLLRASSAVSEHIKKEVFHRRPANDRDLRVKLASVFNAVELIAGLLGWTIESVLERNIEKLRERYPERFETELSINKAQD